MLPTKMQKILGRYAILPKKYFNQIRNKTHLRQKQIVSDEKLNIANEAHKQSEKLVRVADTAQEVLLKVDSVFPLMLFPDSLVVDRQKLTLIHRSFFGSANIINIQIGDIQIIEANIGPVFGSLRITSTQFSSTVNQLNFLTRRNAMRAQRLLQGFVVAHEKKIDCTSIDKQKLIALISDLGRGDVGA